MPTQPWVSVDEVAQHLGVVRDTVYRWIDGRGLPAHKVGRLWKFKLDEVDAWVRGGSAADPAEPEASVDLNPPAPSTGHPARRRRTAR